MNELREMMNGRLFNMVRALKREIKVEIKLESLYYIEFYDQKSKYACLHVGSLTFES